MAWPDLSDEAIHAALVEVAPLSDYCLVGARFGGELVYVRNFQGHWGACIIENDAESRATKDYLRRAGAGLRIRRGVAGMGQTP